MFQPGKKHICVFWDEASKFLFYKYLKHIFVFKTKQISMLFLNIIISFCDDFNK